MSRRQKDEWEQVELDTRKALDRAIDQVASNAITQAQDLTSQCAESPNPVHNRHEAYGIAAEHFARINKAVHAIKADMATLLGTLADVNLPAIEAVSDLCNSTEAAVCVLVKTAAEMRRTRDDLYAAELESDTPTPIEELAAGPEYEEAPATERQNPEESGENKED